MKSPPHHEIEGIDKGSTTGRKVKAWRLRSHGQISPKLLPVQDSGQHLFQRASLDLDVVGHLHIHPESGDVLKDLPNRRAVSVLIRRPNVNNNATQKPRRFQRGSFNTS
ncbi:hypothetical protein ACDY96_21675 [Rhizobium mongolense]|uniref:hypothetical protein n=1 Tax=Rhizobium TaxID=379 RepID=UPI0024B1CE9A|nr:hypothetical protein [Rhizobium sp. CC1099]WFU88616.1 hypothetical protein QA644_05980 [Rhizobium sp. CC1099]